MKQKHKVQIFNRKTNNKSYLQIYNSLDEFIDSFPFAERQDKEQIEKELDKNGSFRFSDFDCPHQYILTRL